MDIANEIDVGDDFEIRKVTRQAAGTGTWVCGRIAGFRFDALVFPAPAERSEWELGQSRISKLWLARTSDRQTVFNWDRGPDRPATDQTAQAAVDFLVAGLVEHVYGT